MVELHLEIRDGILVSALAGSAQLPTDVPVWPMRQGLVWPCFSDIHTHLDKGHTWPRRPNIEGTFQAALSYASSDQKTAWTPADIHQRMEFGLRCSYAHGTQLIRTHLDSAGGQAATSFKLVSKLQQDWAGRVEIQAVCLVGLDTFATDEGVALANLVADYGGLLGGVIYPDPQLDTYLDRVFSLAQERQLDLDFHTDESLDPNATGLRQVAEAKLRHDFQGQVLCGHCCSLSVQSPEAVAQTIQWVKAADLAVVSLPMCNLFLQDRQIGAQTPRFRGVTLLHELRAAGVPVALASDNCRDAFFAYGDHDMLEVFNQSVRIGHLDCPFDRWPQAVTLTPARVMGMPERGCLGLGQSADLIAFKARTLNELLARPQSDRIVLRQGRSIDTTLPDYAELDHLMV